MTNTTSNQVKVNYLERLNQLRNGKGAAMSTYTHYVVAINASKELSEYWTEKSPNYVHSLHNGRVMMNRSDKMAFAYSDVVPLKGNLVPVYGIKADGTRELLDASDFWGRLAGTKDGKVNSCSITVDLGMKAAEVRKMHKAGIIRSLEIKIGADVENYLIPDVRHGASKRLNKRFDTVTLRPVNAEVTLSENVVITSRKRYASGVLNGVRTAAETNTIANVDTYFEACTASSIEVTPKSEPTTEAPIAQTKAAISSLGDIHPNDAFGMTAPKAAPVQQPAAKPSLQEIMAMPEVKAMMQQMVKDAIANNAKASTVEATKVEEAKPEATHTVKEPITIKVVDTSSTLEGAASDCGSINSLDELGDLYDEPLDECTFFDEEELIAPPKKKEEVTPDSSAQVSGAEFFEAIDAEEEAIDSATLDMLTGRIGNKYSGPAEV